MGTQNSHMQQGILSIKLEKDVEVTQNDIFLKDVGSIYCKNDTIVNACNSIKLGELSEMETRKVISVMKVIELIVKQFPGIQVVNIGETDVLLERVKPEQKGKGRLFIKIAFVALISFFGTAFTIMAFHNDIQIQDLFNKVHEMILGKPSNGHSILEFAYSIGLCVGIIVFFNHIGGKRISKDPTPLEVSMKRYEEDVNQTLIEEADRMNIEVDTKG